MADRVSVSPITDDMARRIVQAIADPGHFLKRGDDYTEPIPSWSGRAVVQVLNEWLADASVGCAATTGTPVEVTDDMVRRGAIALNGGHERHAVDRWGAEARCVLEGALGGVSAGYAGTPGAQVARERTAVHADLRVSPVTDDMVVRAVNAWYGVDPEELDPEDETACADAMRELLSAALAGCTVVPGGAREELIGCHHPGWPDPLGFNWGDDPRENARRWFEENREKHPQIKVRRRIVTEWEDLHVADPGSQVGDQQ